MRDYTVCDECKMPMRDERAEYVKTEQGFRRTHAHCKKAIQDRGEAIESLPVILMELPKC
jgi:hypothetical protein